MEPVFLFSLASAQARWSAIRQAAVAENVANANTPGYQALEVAPFSSVYEAAGLEMTTTHPNDMTPNLFDLASYVEAEGKPWEVSYSGNSVNLDQEMLTANDIYRNYSMNMAIVKSFNQMLSMSVKGPSS